MADLAATELQDDDVVRAVSERIADGDAVDWEALLQRGLTAEQREQLEGLRLLEEIGKLACLPDEDEDEADAAGPGADDREEVQPDGTFGNWGKYRLRELVGDGSFGSVYRAIDPQLDLEVAIKILHERVDDPRTREQLLAEGRMLAKVKHPNVVSVYGMEFEGSQAGLCTEFVRGDTLEGVLKAEGPLDASQAVPIAQHVCEALAAVHEAGFIHRDVKARNVMREKSGRIVLMDFGTGRSAKQLAAGRFDNTGTPLYMAPEVLVRGQPATECSDVYSVGVLLFHLVTGRYPVEGQTLDELQSAHREGRAHAVGEFQPDLSPRFVRVVQRALAANPRERFRDPHELLDALGRVFGLRLTLRTIAKRLPAAGVVALAAAASLTAIGFVSSRTFNIVLGRTAFATDTPRDWLVLGLRSSFAPILLVVLVFLLLALIRVMWRLVTSLSSAARSGDDRLRAGLRRAGRRLRLDDPSVLTSWIVLFSSAGLVWAWWYYLPLIHAATTDISTAPVEQLALLSPAAEDYQGGYRQVFSELGILTSLAWYGAARLARRRGRTLNRLSLAAGTATIVLLLASAALPYRLIHEDNQFATARWKGADCYIIGERADEVLLFCPSLPSPRTRVLPKSAGEVQRLDKISNIFESFSGAAAAVR